MTSDPSSSGSARNRPISRFVASFAILSLAASVLPLLTHGGGQSVVPALERGATFTAYCVFLFVFVFFLLPGAFRRDTGNGLVPWAPLAAFSLLFASIPGIVSAYVSGVARPQALFLGGLIGCSCAVVVLLRAVFGRFAVALSFGLGCLLLFVAPAVDALAWTTATRLAVPIEILSPISWLRRVAFLREPVDPRGMLIAAGVAWALVVVVAAARRGRRAVAVAASALLFVPAMGSWQSAPEITIRPSISAAVRPGVRVPLAITVKGGGGEAFVAFRSETVRVPADGTTSTALLVLAPGESECEVNVAGQRLRAALPLRFTDPAKAIVGTAGAASLAETIATVLPAAEVVPIDVAAAPSIPGAFEALDAIVIADVDWHALTPERRNQLRDYAALGGAVIRIRNVAESAPETIMSGNLQIVASPWSLKGVNLRRPIDPNAFDPTLMSLFARPDWQALDLSKLLLFLLAYHAAFFVAFLLPFGLDSHKSAAVYLVSVGTVMIVVVLASWWSLRQFFLRDNQVYTQSLTFVTAPAEDGKAVARQFRCYASMSGEERDFPWDPARDLTAYRDPSARGRVLATSAPPRLDDVWLDRFQSKLLVREDLVQDAPLELVPDGSGFRIERKPKAPDPLGLKVCTLTAAVVIEEDGTLRSATVEGNRIVVQGAAAPGEAPAFDAFARALVGRFRRGGPGPGKRLVIVRAAGVRRLDDVTGFFHVADLQSILAFEP